MIDPPPCASMGFTAAWQHRNIPGQVNADRLVPAFQRVVFEGACLLPVVLGVELRIQGSAVDQDIQLGIGFQGSLHHTAYRFRRGNVDLHGA